jgi:hypothetical protein
MLCHEETRRLEFMVQFAPEGLMAAADTTMAEADLVAILSSALQAMCTRPSRPPMLSYRFAVP